MLMEWITQLVNHSSRERALSILAWMHWVLNRTIEQSLFLTFSRQMESVSVDVLHTAIVPFLQQRDLMVLRSVSKRIRDCMPQSSQELASMLTTTPLYRYVCVHSGCTNRAFLFNTIDPCTPYVQVPTFVVFVQITKIICLFPLYSIPFLQILYRMMKQDAYNPSRLEQMELQSALSNYRSVDDCLFHLMGTPHSIMCTCTSLLSHCSNLPPSETCGHTGWCLFTERRECILCLLSVTSVNERSSELPGSFYVYMGFFAIGPIFASMIIGPIIAIAIGCVSMSWICQ
jgi:hypothetical protein